MSHAQQSARFETGHGFIAALDQSGGSTPKALRAYGIEESQYSNDTEMFDLIHAARTRIITSPVFTSERILGAILFENTLDRDIQGKGSAAYLWEDKGIVPFLKIDKGLEDVTDGVQLMRPNPGLGDLLARARDKGVYGTKERSVIHTATTDGITAVVDQQFQLADHVLDAGLVPIIEPEVSIDAADKADAEGILKEQILTRLDSYTGTKVALKLTIPTVDGFYSDLIAHPAVARVVALSGGYSRDDANARLARNPGLIASFSRALLDGLSADQDDDQFDKALDAAIEPIYQASLT
ncbi:fructose bisphosphate aldolase [Cellulomonas bogoriensis]|uniref:fructose-bisphosphate aldolase n=1 Tax=Cellulomonas bogoriensis 69B4 = DSM 16987 TaxID=1386082 RepID=A0A0A0C183_9CELL|nr:fructose bisphosphate aldolase [Cellulomonas bogoriensis]KGM13976.1 fructose-1,6-bisphosphate aldolase [Cellulomonas bogoriensis 69B4 = DSM 16987]